MMYFLLKKKISMHERHKARRQSGKSLQTGKRNVIIPRETGCVRLWRGEKVLWVAYQIRLFFFLYGKFVDFISLPI